MNIQFQGAAQTVTGSMHIVTVAGKKILLDCGLMQGRRSEAHETNKSFPFDPKEIDAIVLSHAHIDHSGNLPGIVRHGYHGPIFSTPATRDLCSIMLMDSAFLQEKDAEHLQKHQKEFVEPLYSVEDAQAALALFRSVPYHQEFQVAPGITCTFYDAGHILGSASVYLTLREAGKTVRLAFTGDMGRKGRPIIRDPEYLPPTDYLLCESTYGDRLHGDPNESVQKFKEVIRETHRTGGRLIIPAFSVGRTQDLLYTLHQLTRNGEIDPLPVYVDSPLSSSATSVYRMHTECFDEDVRKHILRDPDALGFDTAKYITSVEDSKKLNDIKTPCMIISASGMCEGGRVLHHLAHAVEDPRNIVLIVGYMAPNTLGRRLVEKVPMVRIYGDEYQLRCKVVTLNGMSAHADQHDIVEFITHLDQTQLKHVYLVHGDEDRESVLIDVLAAQGVNSVSPAVKGAVVNF